MRGKKRERRYSFKYSHHDFTSTEGKVDAQHERNSQTSKNTKHL